MPNGVGTGRLVTNNNRAEAMEQNYPSCMADFIHLVVLLEERKSSAVR
jgi:hypothetical protein